MQKCRKKVKSCLKQVSSNKALAGKVLQSLFTAGVVCVCTFGGDNAAWASDYTGTDTLSTGAWGASYDKITITMDDPGKNCAGIYTYGRNNTTTATERVTVTLSDAGDTYEIGRAHV